MMLEQHPSYGPDSGIWPRVALSPLDENSLERIWAWQNSPDLRDLTMGFRFPMQRAATAEWIRRKQVDTGHNSATFAACYDEEIVGTLQLNDLNWLHRRASLGIYIGSKEHRRSGIGLVACTLILDYAFRGLNLNRIELDVLAANSGAVSLFESLGFQREGQKRGHYFLDGVYLDVFSYGLLSSEWERELPSAANRLIHTIR
jgi:UDP-4-amino-4,6-dideoxy-N-acetyl-beta-L-altrosamine N-acetyltransferase